MAIREIITVPDPLLRKVSEPVERVDRELLKLLDDMLQTMYDAPGIGLAAIQIAVPRRVLVMDIARKEEEPQPFYLINPKIVASSDTMRCHEEGCLSIPEYYAEVERPDAVTVQYLDRDGKEQEQEFTNLLATVVQHEIDHLDGKQFIDYISKLKRDRVVKKLTKDRKKATESAL
jgi:peptide deformylase